MRKHKGIVWMVLALLGLALASGRARHEPAQAEIPSVVIGRQTWMARNLEMTTFRNGDSIPEARTLQAWREAAREKRPAWCYPNNDSLLGALYGKLYNEFAVSDPRGLAPQGWRMPDAADWRELGRHLGGNKRAGEKLKSAQGWTGRRPGNNESGFSALPGGARVTAMINPNEGFVGVGKTGYWWTSTVDRRTGEYLVWGLDANNQRLLPIWDTFSSDGYSVRCIKETP